MNSASEIQSQLALLADKEIARHSQRFFKTGKGEYAEGDIFRGIRVPELRKLSRSCKNLPTDECVTLLKSEFHEDRLLALFILVLKFRKKDEQLRWDIYQIYLTHTLYINNWDLIDSSAEHIVGGYLWTKNRDVLYSLAESENLWERRISIMATFFFIRKGDFEDTLRIAEKLLSDTEDLIHKATGWMLREVGNRDFQAEADFLSIHYKTMPRTMLRYAIEKFPEEIRQNYLKGTA